MRRMIENSNVEQANVGARFIGRLPFTKIAR